MIWISMMLNGNSLCRKVGRPVNNLWAKERQYLAMGIGRDIFWILNKEQFTRGVLQ